MPRIEISGNGGMYNHVINSHDPRIIAAWLVEQIIELTIPPMSLYPITLHIAPGHFANGAPDWPLDQSDGIGNVVIDPGTSARNAVLGLRGMLDKYLETMPRDTGAPNI